MKTVLKKTLGLATILALLFVFTKATTADITCMHSETLTEGESFTFEGYTFYAAYAGCDDTACEATFDIQNPDGTEDQNVMLSEGESYPLRASDYNIQVTGGILNSVTVCVYTSQPRLEFGPDLEVAETDSEGCPSVLKYTLTNTGNTVAEQVDGRLRIEDGFEDVCIQRQAITYGNIQPGETEDGIGYRIRVYGSANVDFAGVTYYKYNGGQQQDHKTQDYPSLYLQCSRPYASPHFTAEPTQITYDPDNRPASYTIELTNTGGEKAYNVKATIVDHPLGVEVGNPTVDCGHIEPGATTQCSPTAVTTLTDEDLLDFTLRIDYTNCVDPDNSAHYDRTATLQLENKGPANLIIKDFKINPL